MALEDWTAALMHRLPTCTILKAAELTGSLPLQYVCAAGRIMKGRQAQMTAKKRGRGDFFKA